MQNKKWLLNAALTALLFGQTSFPSQVGKPKLIREPVQEAPKEEESLEKKAPSKPDPAKAKKNMEVGKYYFGQKKWEAAADRFRTSSQWNPSVVEAWEWLARSLEKQKKYREAAEALDQYRQKFPNSAEAVKFGEEEKRLRKKEDNSNLSTKPSASTKLP